MVADIKWYVNPKTRTIHRVDSFPAPRRRGYTNCGKPLYKLEEYTSSLIPRASLKFCERCKQLTGG